MLRLNLFVRAAHRIFCVALVALLGTLLASAPLTARASIYTQLYSFPGFALDGAHPQGGMVQGLDGRFYGTTVSGGAFNWGTVFCFDAKTGAYAILHNFSFSGVPTDGAAPSGTLIQTPDGVLYGTTYLGGENQVGTVFRINPDGSGFSTLHAFLYATDGANPIAGVIAVGDKLYGTTSQGGAFGTTTGGTAYLLSRLDGSGFTVLHNFGGGTDGQSPYGGLIEIGGSKPFLYGTTFGGGKFGQGVVFKMKLGGSGYHIMRHLGATATDAANPASSLLLAGSFLYGTTYSGGASGFGTVFHIKPSGTGYHVIHSFAGAGGDGANPYTAPLVQGADGLFYGTTQNGGSSNAGTAFQMKPSGVDAVLHSFTGSPDGASPVAPLVQSFTDGLFYGVAFNGGAGGSPGGAIFRVGP